MTILCNARGADRANRRLWLKLRNRTLYVLLIPILATPSLAQGIAGTVIASSAASGIPGVIVQLTDSSGIILARAMSRPDGGFTLRAPRTGSFTIRTLRLGFRPSTFGPFVIGDAGLSGLRLVLDEVPVSLTGVNVVATSECVRTDVPDDGSVVMTAWEEARKSLLASVLSRSRSDLVVTTTTYQRTLTPATGRVVRQIVTQRTGRGDRPFVSPLPPEVYATVGYRSVDDDGTVYRAPDADVLLSETFAEAHCLNLVEGKSGSELGIAFSPRASPPAERRKGQPFVDVEGTLWLDRQSNRLLRTEFRYTGVEQPVRDAGAGGALEFGYFPDGLTVVTSWSIRAPRLVIVTSVKAAPTTLGSGAYDRLQSERREKVGELWVFGGELTAATTAASVYRRDKNANLFGITTGARSHLAAPGTTVMLDGTTYAATSDSTGHYNLSGVLPGRYDVLVLSAISAHLEVPAVRSATIDLRAGESTELSLEAPEMEDALAARCGKQAEGKRAAIVGVVANFTGQTIPHALIHLSWPETYTIQAGGYGVQRGDAFVRSDSLGWFHVCGVPRERPIDLAVVTDSTAGAVLGSMRVRVPPEDAFVRARLYTGARIPADSAVLRTRAPER